MIATLNWWCSFWIWQPFYLLQTECKKKWKCDLIIFSLLRMKEMKKEAAGEERVTASHISARQRNTSAAELGRFCARKVRHQVWRMCWDEYITVRVVFWRMFGFIRGGTRSCSGAMIPRQKQRVLSIFRNKSKKLFVRFYSNNVTN